MTIRESITQASDGQTSITELGGGLYHIDSFFDVFTELSVDGGSSWIASDAPARMDLAPIPRLVPLVGPAEVHVFYDPRAPLDAMHAALFRGDNVSKYRCRFMGHRIASLWLLMGVLKPVIEGCVAGTMTQAQFYTLMRKRREVPRFQRDLLGAIEATNRPQLVSRYCNAVLSLRGGPVFRRALRAAEARLAKGKK